MTAVEKQFVPAVAVIILKVTSPYILIVIAAQCSGVLGPKTQAITALFPSFWERRTKLSEKKFDEQTNFDFSKLNTPQTPQASVLKDICGGLGIDMDKFHPQCIQWFYLRG